MAECYCSSSVGCVVCAQARKLADLRGDVRALLDQAVEMRRERDEARQALATIAAGRHWRYLTSTDGDPDACEAACYDTCPACVAARALAGAP